MMIVLVLVTCGVMGGRGEGRVDAWEDVEEQEVVTALLRMRCLLTRWQR